MNVLHFIAIGLILWALQSISKHCSFRSHKHIISKIILNQSTVNPRVIKIKRFNKHQSFIHNVASCKTQQKREPKTRNDKQSNHTQAHTTTTPRMGYKKGSFRLQWVTFSIMRCHICSHLFPARLTTWWLLLFVDRDFHPSEIQPPELGKHLGILEDFCLSPLWLKLKKV